MNIHLVVPNDYDDSVRLDVFVASQIHDMNRSHLKASATKIMLNGKEAKLSAKIKARDTIDIEYTDTVADDIKPENIALNIIFENENVTVVNKERGMVTHPAAGNWSGTLVNALLFHWKRGAIVTEKNSPLSVSASHRPGIVHRLDKETSGVIITAKNRKSETWLQEQFKSRRARKEYIAIVRGRPPAASGDIRTQIIRDPKNRKIFCARENTTEGKYARTLYHCVACYGQYSVMRLRIKTGRTHQIRVHMKYIGCPILGDTLYTKTDSLFPNAPLMLHSRLLEIRLPDEKKLTVFRACLPDDFLKIHQALKNKFPRTVITRTKATESKTGK